MLEKTYQERVAGFGIAKGAPILIELYVNNQSGTFTLLAVEPNLCSYPVIAGIDWTFYDPTPRKVRIGYGSRGTSSSP